MDFGLSKRRAFVTHPNDAVGAACIRALTAEGVEVVDELEIDSVGGGVDIVVALSSARDSANLLDVSSETELYQSWEVVVETIDLYRKALPNMSDKRWGRFIWIGTADSRSLDARPGDENDELGAIVTLAMRAADKVVAAEAGAANITANSVLHGGDATPDDVAATVAFLCSNGAGYTTGVTITVDGGQGSAMF
jgi:NAD(P)-dependent dehydrogenase (short-subunit alcohol dehydrogenase family)